MRTQVRQGDVLLNPVGEAPADAHASNGSIIPGRVVIAFGELSGHHHSVAAWDAELLLSEFDGVFLSVRRPTRLEHQEHAPITLGAGLYEVRLQREFTPLGDAPAWD